MDGIRDRLVPALELPLEFAMKFLLLALTFLFSLFQYSLLWPQTETERPKIGLALSGGGARGGAHVGVLKALEELGIQVDYIAGTSMGAIIGGLYASGYSVADIEELLRSADWDRALTDRPERRDRTMRKKEVESDFLVPYRLGFNHGRLQAALGAIEGQHLDQLFQRILMPVSGVRDFDNLPIPFRAVATDLATGEEVVLEEGSLAEALRASMSVPGAFVPVRLEGRLLVDGGMANNLPISVVRAMGADVVIAVDISSPLLSEEQLTSVLSVTYQLTNFLTRRTTERQLESMGPDDVLIVPELGDFSAADFDRAEEIIHLGEEAALARSDRLASLAGQTELPRVASRDLQAGAYIVQFVEILNGSVLNDELIRSRLAVTQGEPLDVRALELSLDRIYSLDVFESVSYDLAENDAGETGLQITALPRHWGPNYLQFGLELSSNFSGSSEFKLGAAYTRNALNQLGGELRVLTSIGREDELNFNFYQPVDLEARWFVNPELRWKRRSYTLWYEESRIAEYELSGWAAALGVGRNFGSTDELRLSYRYGRTEGDLYVGILPPLGDDRIRVGEAVLSYRHDSLDSLYFPTEGSAHGFWYRYADEGLGSESDYDQAGASGSFVFSGGKNNASVNYDFGYSFQDKALASRWFQMGGFSRLSGLAPDQLLGPHAGLLSLVYYRRTNEIRFFPAYAGFTVEAGNVWASREDIGFDNLRYSGSLFLGAESPLGPLYFAVGYSDGGDTAAYFYLGNPFRPNQIE
jgi:NTE family protein